MPDGTLPQYMMWPDDYVRVANIDKMTPRGPYTATNIPSEELFDYDTVMRLQYLEFRSGRIVRDVQRGIDPLNPAEKAEYDKLKWRQHMMATPAIDGHEFPLPAGAVTWVKWDRAQFLVDRWPELTILNGGERPDLIPAARPSPLATAHQVWASQQAGNDKGKQVLVEVEGDASDAKQTSARIVASKFMGNETGR